MPQEKLIPAAVFTQGVATPKHDEMLLLYEQNSERLNKIINYYKDEFIEKYNKEESWDSIIVVTLLDNSKTAYKNLKYIEIENKFYIFYTANADTYRINYFEKCKTKEELDDFIKSYVYTDEKVREVKNIEHRDCDIKYESKINIKEWNPEKPILGFNKYYIGSVDLYICFEIKLIGNLLIDKEDCWVWKDYKLAGKEYTIIFEFKPEIKSYSETIRQVKVYNSYFKDAIFFVITYSNISKFQSIFESQGIKIYNP